MKRPVGFSGAEDPAPRTAADEPATVRGAGTPKPGGLLRRGFGRGARNAAATAAEGKAPDVADLSARAYDDSDDLLTVPLDDVRLPSRQSQSVSAALPSITDHDATPDEAYLAPTAVSSESASSFAAADMASLQAAQEHTGKRMPGALAARLNRGMVAAKPKDLDPVVAAERELKRAKRASKRRERRDQRRFTAQSRGRRRHWWIGVGAVLVLAASVLVGVFTPIMAVRSVEVIGAQQVNLEEVQQALGRFDGVPLALVGDTELHRALEPFPLIQMYSVERIPPDTLRVHIEERVPVIAIAADSGANLVDAAGVLTGNVSEVPAGIVRASGGVVDTASPAFTAAATVIRDLPEDVRLQIAEVKASGEQDIEFLLHSGSTVVWGDSADTQRKAVVVRAMLVSVSTASRIDVSAPEAPVFQ